MDLCVDIRRASAKCGECQDLSQRGDCKKILLYFVRCWQNESQINLDNTENVRHEANRIFRTKN